MDPAALSSRGGYLDPISFMIFNGQYIVLGQPSDHRALRSGTVSQMQRLCGDSAGGKWCGSRRNGLDHNRAGREQLKGTGIFAAYRLRSKRACQGKYRQHKQEGDQSHFSPAGLQVIPRYESGMFPDLKKETSSSCLRATSRTKLRCSKGRNSQICASSD